MVFGKGLVPLALLSVVAMPVGSQRPGEGRDTHSYVTSGVTPTDARIAGLKVPQGFRVSIFARGLDNPRMLAVGPDGEVYVTERSPGNLIVFHNGEPTRIWHRADLHGIAIHRGKMYLATPSEVLVADIQRDGSINEPRVIIRGIPAGGHDARTLGVGPDNKLYIGVGSTCNACHEPSPLYATILQANLDGTGMHVFASGLRNTEGFGWHPKTRRMFGMDHGIDWLGDDEPGEKLNELVAGACYGWPSLYDLGKFNTDVTPPDGSSFEAWKRKCKEPVLLYGAHAAPLQMAFYTGRQFPTDYHGDAFVAMHGSWNRFPPRGYEVVRIKFDGRGNPVWIRPFLTGFLVKESDSRYVQFGRPAGVAVDRDGSLLVSDDTHGVIYRVSYTGRG